MPSTRLIPMAAAAALLSVLSACGGGSSAAAPAATAPAASVPAATTSAAASGAAIDLGNTSLGMVLTDAQGRTLYMFVPDQAAGASTCYDQCATAWPPVLTTGSPVAGTGIDASLLGTTNRTDGTVQVTYNKLPLYLFAQDSAAGDVNGQGVKNVWYVMDAKGTVVKTSP